LKNYTSLKEALQQTFPELNFSGKGTVKRKRLHEIRNTQKLKHTTHKGTKRPNQHWADVKNCRVFFDDVAKAKGFDPLVAENWYAIKLNVVVVHKVRIQWPVLC